MRVTPSGSSAARAAGSEAADSSAPTTVVGALLCPTTRGRRTSGRAVQTRFCGSFASNTPVTSTGTAEWSALTRVEGVTGTDAEDARHLVGQRDLHGAVRPGTTGGAPGEPADRGILPRPQVAHPQDAAGRQPGRAEREVGAGGVGDGRPEDRSQRRRQHAVDAARCIVDARPGVRGAGRRVRRAGAVGAGDDQVGGRIGLRDGRPDGGVRPVGQQPGHRVGERRP